jgi:hypothetical protein
MIKHQPVTSVEAGRLASMTRTAHRAAKLNVAIRTAPDQAQEQQDRHDAGGVVGLPREPAPAR